MQRVWKQVIVLLVSVSFFCTGILMLGSRPAKAQDDYTFGGETVNKGTTANPSNKNVEDALYETLVEEDQYPDTNFTGTTEAVTTGTAGGAAFPASLTTDDASRRSYTEANTAPANYVVYLFPNSDWPEAAGTKWATIFPTSPTTHFPKVNQKTVNGDSDTSYLGATATTQFDIFNMDDMTAPSGSPTLQVQIWGIVKKMSSSASNFQEKMRIGTTNYTGVSTSSLTTSYANYSKGYTTNPAGGAWTYTAINAATINILTSTITANPRATQIGMKVYVNYTVTYAADVTITYSSVTSTSQTTSYAVYCQGYRSASENFVVSAWDYVGLVWDSKTTIQAASDTDYNFALTTNERSASLNEVKLRITDATPTDTVQDIVYFDVLKVRRIEIGYALDVVMTSTTVAQYGNITLRIKGYTSAETFKVNVWNYTSAAYDLNKLSITSTSNAWQTTVDLCDVHHRSGTTVQIQFVDGTASSADIVQDTLYLDVVWVTRYHTNPVASKTGALPNPVNLGSNVNFFLTYSDYDNEVPATNYPKVHVDITDYSMTANDSETAYTTGKTYHYDKADLAGGAHTYYFIVKDVNSAEVTTGSTGLTVNNPPALALDGVTPATGNNGDTFHFYVNYSDPDNNAPSYIKAHIDSTDYDMTANNSYVNYIVGKSYHYDKAMSGGSHTYYFKTADYMSANVQTGSKGLSVNNPPVLSGFGRAPADPVYVTTQLNFTVTFTDNDNDLPVSVKWREGGGAIQNLTMTQIVPSDQTTTDGKTYFVWITLSHGAHNYDFYAADSLSTTSGGSNSVTIANQAPTIDSGPTDPHVYRNIYWSYDFNATDLDGDTVTWANSGASFLAINPSTGLLYGTTSNTPGSYPITVWGNDSYSGSANYPFTLYIDNRNPSISSTGNTTQAFGDFMSYHIIASDSDTDALTYAKSSNASFLSLSGTYLNGTCNQHGSFSYSIWANDSYGGSATQQYTLTITNHAPMISSSGNTTEPFGVFMAYHIIASDQDEDSLSYALSTNASFLSISGAWVNGTPNNHGIFSCDVWANDSYSGSAHEHWELSVLNHDPSISSSGNTTQAFGTYMAYHIMATDSDNDPLSYSLSTNAGFLSLSGAWVNGSINQFDVFDCDVWVNDSFGGTDYQHWQLTVNNQNPYFTTTPIYSCDYYSTYSYDANATDPESQTLTYGLSSNAGFLSINSTTGVVSGVANQIGEFYANVSTSDGTNAAHQNYTLTVTNQPASFTSTPIYSGTFGAIYSYDANATDPEDQPLTYNLESNASFLNINVNSGVVSGTVNETGIFYVHISAFDGVVYTWQNYSLTVDNLPPSFEGIPIETVSNHITYSYNSHAVDPENSALTYGLETDAVWLSINSTTGILSGIANGLGIYYVHVNVTDGTYLVWQNYTLTVFNEAPYFTTSPFLTGTVNVSYYYHAHAIDNNSDTLVYSLVDSPVWAFVDPNTGEVEGTASLPGNYDFHLRVWDGYTYTWQNWTQADDYPSIPPPPILGPYPQDMSGLTLLVMLGGVGIGVYVVFTRITNKGKPAKKPERKEKKK